MNVLYRLWANLPMWAWIAFALLFLGWYFFASLRRGFEQYIARLIDRRLSQRRDRD